MTTRYADRVFQTSTTTGTGSYLLGPVMPGGYQAFSDVPGIVDGDTVYVSIDQEYSNDFEVGLYTYRAAGFLERTTILASSRDGLLPVPWQSGATRRVALTLTAAQIDGANLQYVGAPLVTDRTVVMRAGVLVLTDLPAVGPSVPAAPVIGTAQAGNATVSIYFTPPASDGGSTILDYTAYLSDGTSATGTVSPIVFTGKTNGQSYNGNVKARNAIGLGPASATSNSVVPAVTVVPPTITAQPSAQSVTAPATATFSVAATTGGGTLTYQWYKSTDSGTTWVLISGATSASYTTPATTTGDTGALFRCNVANSAGNVNSNSAALTVAANSKARYGTGGPTAGVSTPAALLASMTEYGTANASKAGSFTIAAGGAGVYGWVAIEASASSAGVVFGDAIGVGGWQGASSAANNSADPGVSPNTSAVTYTDANAVAWRFFRLNYANAPFDGSTS